MGQLSNSALDVEPHVVRVQITGDLLGIHEFGQPNLKNDAGLIRTFIITPLVLALVALTNLAIFSVNRNRLLLFSLLTSNHIVVVLEHTILLLLSLGLFFLCHRLFINLTTVLRRVFIRIDAILFF